jgi:membrane associated rhomboid family serine protease
LIIANVVAYVLSLLIGHYEVTSVLAVVPSRVVGLEPLGILSLLTYQFLHGGTWHLAINMLLLWMFGSELEERWGSRFFLKYYFLCGVGGGLTYALLSLSQNAPSVGASGAIYGLLMAYAIWFPNRVVLLAFLFPIRVRHVIVFLVVIQTLQAIEATGTGIAYTAHLGGTGFGYVYLRWWGARGQGAVSIPGLSEIRRAYYRWRLKRVQRKRWGTDDGPPTFH